MLHYSKSQVTIGVRRRWALCARRGLAIAFLVVGACVSQARATLPEALASACRATLTLVAPSECAVRDARIAVVFSCDNDSLRDVREDFSAFVLQLYQLGTVVAPDSCASVLGKYSWHAGRLLYKHERRDAFLRGVGALRCVLVSIRTVHDSCEVVARAYLESQDQPEAMARVAIIDDHELRIYLNEPIPGVLVVRAPEESRIQIDGEDRGAGGKVPVSLSLDPGEHQVAIVKPTFARFQRHIAMTSDAGMELRVHERDCSGVPAASLLASALVPGLGALMYGRPKSDRRGSAGPEATAYTGAAIFYVAGGLAVADILREPTFLTKRSRSTYHKIEVAEIGAAVVGYVLNMVGALAIGRDFAARNRELIANGDPSSKYELEGTLPADGRIVLEDAARPPYRCVCAFVIGL